MKKLVLTLLTDESGLTTVEYAVGSGIVTIAGVAAFAALGITVANAIQDLVTRAFG